MLFSAEAPYIIGSNLTYATRVHGRQPWIALLLRVLRTRDFSSLSHGYATMLTAACSALVHRIWQRHGPMVSQQCCAMCSCSGQCHSPEK